jgi:uncharacterized membrane protein YfcA
MDPSPILSGFGVRILVGTTGIDGGSLMTPLALVLRTRPPQPTLVARTDR